MTRFKFEWQDDYYAVSIGTPQLGKLREYIRNQVRHHTKISFEEELAKIIEEYKIERFMD